jgi:hypothetical protein
LALPAKISLLVRRAGALAHPDRAPVATGHPFVVARRIRACAGTVRRAAGPASAALTPSAVAGGSAAAGCAVRLAVAGRSCGG